MLLWALCIVVILVNAGLLLLAVWRASLLVRFFLRATPPSTERERALAKVVPFITWGFLGRNFAFGVLVIGAIAGLQLLDGSSPKFVAVMTLLLLPVMVVAISAAMWNHIHEANLRRSLLENDPSLLKKENLIPATLEPGRGFHYLLWKSRAVRFHRAPTAKTETHVYYEPGDGSNVAIEGYVIQFPPRRFFLLRSSVDGKWRRAFITDADLAKLSNPSARVSGF